MNKKVSGVAASLIAAVGLQAAYAAPPGDLDALMARGLSTFEVPGMAIALVEADQPPLAKGYGVRKLGDPARVDEHTLFAIASNTKAYTAAALAILVDDGKLSWDDKVADRLPGFRMYDAYTSHEMTIRDLLTHRSGLGLGAGDLLTWPETTFTRSQIVEKLRYIPPATSFRSGYAYDNILYIVAGEVVSHVSGQPWEQFVSSRIFAPLGMTESVTSFKLVTTQNRAWPHARLGKPVRGFGKVEPLQYVPPIDNGAPAGGINASVADMTKWLSVQLNHGAYVNGRLFSEAASRQMWTPHTIIPVEREAAPLEALTPNFETYGLGWEIRDYRGHRILMHLGLVEGATSQTFLIPEKQVGFIIVQNSEDGEARTALGYHLLDHYLGLPPTDWINAFFQSREQVRARALKVLESKSPARGLKSPPSLLLAEYAGIYRDKWFGTVAVEVAGKGLTIRFDGSPILAGPLEHVRGETFRTRFPNPRAEDAFVTFSMRADGSIDQVKMEAISPLADFSFDYQDLRLERN